MLQRLVLVWDMFCHPTVRILSARTGQLPSDSFFTPLWLRSLLGSLLSPHSMEVSIVSGFSSLACRDIVLSAVRKVTLQLVALVEGCHQRLDSRRWIWSRDSLTLFRLRQRSPTRREADQMQIKLGDGRQKREGDRELSRSMKILHPRPLPKDAKVYRRRVPPSTLASSSALPLASPPLVEIPVVHYLESGGVPIPILLETAQVSSLQDSPSCPSSDSSSRDLLPLSVLRAQYEKQFPSLKASSTPFSVRRSDRIRTKRSFVLGLLGNAVWISQSSVIVY